MTPISDERESSRRFWYLDSSVALRVLLGHSRTATEWFDERSTAGDTFVSSVILELEIFRVIRRESLDVGLAEEFMDGLAVLSMNDQLVEEAARIRPHVKSLDALHLASAQRLGVTGTTIVTHDANMARVADLLGFDTFDPVE